jgi:ribonuclease D
MPKERPARTAADPADAEPEVPTLHEPASGVPSVCSSEEVLADIATAFAKGSGPVALDAERASGHRYGQRAFLVQAKRAGSGIALIDPEAVPDLSPLAEAIAGSEWVLHAATQDLACLADVGLRPQRLFDTELAGRMLNLPRVGLASLTASLLGWHLAKGHGAADWSIRPLPEDYLRYAALDVELLLELRDVLEQRLREAGKWDWAQEEFAALVHWQPHVHADPWRRTSGSHRLRDRRSLAVLRELWQARDRLAQDLDLAPGRVLPDTALVAAAEAVPKTRMALLDLPGFKRQQRRLGLWWQAVRSGLDLPDSALPSLRTRQDGPPPPRSWAGKDPQAAERFGRARAHVLSVAEQHDLPAEILISPDIVRRLSWSPPDPPATHAVAAAMADRGARPWQISLLAAGLAGALAEH